MPDATSNGLFDASSGARFKEPYGPLKCLN